MPKPELLPVALYGDGKPLDVAADRILAGNFNAWSDAKSCANAPLLVNIAEKAPASLSTYTMATATRVLFMFPVYFSLEIQSAAITRVVTVAPWFRSADGGDAEIRITLTDQLPQTRPGVAAGDLPAPYYGSPMFNGRLAQTATWSTTSTTWAKGDDADLSLGVRTNLGYAFLVIEGSGVAECQGLAKMRESARRVA